MSYSRTASGRVYTTTPDTVLLDLTECVDAEESKRALGGFHSVLGFFFFFKILECGSSRNVYASEAKAKRRKKKFLIFFFGFLIKVL